MSNKIVPVVYRQVIDDVIAAVKPEFDDFGVSEDVLADLQHKWQSKVIASRVADFEPPQQPSQHPVYPAHPIHMMQHHPHYAPAHNPYVPPQQQAQPTQVKTEPADNRYILSAPAGVSYALPPLPGPQLNGMKPPTYPGGQQGVLSFPPHPAQLARPAAAPRTYAPPAPATQASSSSAQTPVTQTQQQGTPPQPTPPAQSRPPSNPQKIPQADGPSSSESGSPSPPPNQSYAPRPSHPSLPQPAQTSGTQPGDSEAINSDLDDSDTEGEEDAEEGGQGDTDIVFCTYDKVGRVKNKWKCILKDGMIHVNGKDYVFAKCTGEFEW
ncbi:transcription factor IIA alpha beta subunit [Pisolithus microcarpus]|nr:transcription factor IIA alpha beta subunit [Pisolithus microcarpus]